MGEATSELSTIWNSATGVAFAVCVWPIRPSLMITLLNTKVDKFSESFSDTVRFENVRNLV